LRAAAAASPRLTVRTGTTVLRVASGRGSRLEVGSECGGRAQTEAYDAVVNALWQNRIGIDQTLGLSAARPVLHRFKVGLHSRPSFTPGGMPSVTFVLGPFGDTVNYGRRAYLSWYPVGHLSTSAETAPAESPEEILARADPREVETRTLDAIARSIPRLGDALLRSRGQWDVGGGYITAWGKTGIDDLRSQLHERFEIGVHSTGAYHSIDTGKYTTGPHFSALACDRIAPRTSVATSERPVHRLR
jgi:hypothetical protein